MFFFLQKETVMHLFSGMNWENTSPLPNDLFFLLELRRAMVLEDTFRQLVSAHHSDYKRPLMVNM